MTKRLTIQKTVVREALCQLSHPSAEEVYARVKNEYPHISLATVYRHLRTLVEEQTLQRLTMPDGVDRFDVTVRPHYHTCCFRCGKVEDIDLPYQSELDIEVERLLHRKVVGHETFFAIECEACLKHDIGQNETIH